jgi:hypothetical protein
MLMLPVLKQREEAMVADLIAAAADTTVAAVADITKIAINQAIRI